METLTLRPKPDRRRHPRISPDDVGGDVIVRVDKRQEVFLYVVTTSSGADELQVFTAEEAVVHAVARAKREHARAWFQSDNSCVLLEDFREVKRFRIDFS